MEDIRDELFSRLEQVFDELSMEHKRIDAGDDPEIGGMLMVLVPVPDTDGQYVIMEIALAKLCEGMNFLQLYSTVTMECDQDQEMLLQVLNRINFYCPAGSFGIFSEKGQIYHKSTLIFDDETDAERMADDALLAFHAILIVLDVRAPVLEKLALGLIDLETATRQGLLD